MLLKSHEEAMWLQELVGDSTVAGRIKIFEG